MSRLTERFGQNATTKEPCYIPAGMGTKDQVVLSEIVDKLGRLEDLEEAGRLIELPCKVGDSLYKIVYPYRQPPKVTRYKVKNFRTIRKGQKLQIEVQADSSPVKSWMYFDDFYTTKAEAEAKLEELKGGEQDA